MDSDYGACEQRQSGASNQRTCSGLDGISETRYLDALVTQCGLSIHQEPTDYGNNSYNPHAVGASPRGQRRAGGLAHHRHHLTIMALPLALQQATRRGQHGADEAARRRAAAPRRRLVQVGDVSAK
ncbi:uncharacterized protein LOC134754452 [Cydia strobilella]|uniref:uncharacterized protein LOC134754452 n=1 Tax=Cydia strobilella TaxID=1100964 RepID=UPI0030046698